MPKKKNNRDYTSRSTVFYALTFCTILIVACFLRLYKLDAIPPGVNRDEASIGYTAFSILKTGKDEYGKVYPLSFESFGDWKLPLYIYETVPFIQIFGLNELAVRLPSALAGIMTIGLVYFLVLELTTNPSLSLLAMGLLALAPWHVHLSRVESESNTAVLFITGAVVLLLKSFRQKRWYIIPSFVLFALTYYTYHGNHVFTTLFLIVLIVIHRGNIRKNTYWPIALGIFGIMVTIILSTTLLGADKTKISGISIFGSPGAVHEFIEIPRNEHADPRSILSRISHNRIAFAFERILQNYSKSLSPEFLFISGGTNYAHNIKNMGNLYLIEAIFLPLGIFILLSGKYKDVFSPSFTWRTSLIILAWFFLSPVAASITKDAPHTNRMAAIIPSHVIVIAIGIYWILISVNNYRKRLVILSILCIGLLYVWNVTLYIDRYFVHFPKNESQHWGIGYKDLLKELNSDQNRNKTVIMSHPEYSPYIYFVFYSMYDPLHYQKTVTRYPPTDDAFVHVASYDRYQFRPIDWSRDPKISNVILVELTNDLPPEARQFTTRKDIMFANQKSMWTLLTN